MAEMRGMRCDPGGAGSEVEEGSEIEVDTGNEGNSNNEEWKKVNRKKMKRKQRESDGEKGEEEQRSEIKVILRFQSPCTSNPLKVSEAIHKLVGEVRFVKTLRDGNLLIICRDTVQQHGLMKCKSLLGKEVKPQVWEERGKVMCVISGVSTEITEEEIRVNVRGVRVMRVKRLPFTRDGVKGPSLSVLLTLEEDKIPEKIRIGYVSYIVRPYIPPPMRCFKCQRFGHIAAACKSKLRCAKCGGEHEYGKCERGVKIKCCNCGGEHSAAYKGCDAHKKAVQIQNVKVKEKLSYAEAIRKVKSNENSSRLAPVTQPPVQSKYKCCNVTKDTLIVEKKKFVAFMVEIINCSAQACSRTERTKIIAKAAEKYLDMEEMSVEIINATLIAGISDSQSACGGGD